MSDCLRSCSWDLRESFLYLACCYACPRDFVYYLVEFSPLYLSGSGSCFENRSSVSTVNVGVLVDYSSHLSPRRWLCRGRPGVGCATRSHGQWEFRSPRSWVSPLMVYSLKCCSCWRGCILDLQWKGFRSSKSKVPARVLDPVFSYEGVVGSVRKFEVFMKFCFWQGCYLKCCFCPS